MQQGLRDGDRDATVVNDRAIGAYRRAGQICEQSGRAVKAFRVPPLKTT